MDIEAEPDEASDAAEADRFGTQAGGITGGDARHLGEVIDGSKFHVAGMGQLAHGVELAGNTFASGNAGLSTASKNFFDGVESSVIDAFSESEVERVGRRNMVEREHLKGFEDGKRNAAERMDRGGIEGRCDGASPLQSEGGGDLLFGGKAKFFNPLTDFSIVGAALGFESGANFSEGKLAAGDHEEPEGNAVGRLRRWRHHAQVGELADEGRLQTLGLAIESALEEGSLAVAEALPERSRAQAGDEHARGRGLQMVALDPAGEPG